MPTHSLKLVDATLLLYLCPYYGNNYIKYSLHSSNRLYHTDEWKQLLEKVCNVKVCIAMCNSMLFLWHLDR